jgi:hypothetical protein
LPRTWSLREECGLEVWDILVLVIFQTSDICRSQENILAPACPIVARLKQDTQRSKKKCLAHSKAKPGSSLSLLKRGNWRANDKTLHYVMNGRP